VAEHFEFAVDLPETSYQALTLGDQALVFTSLLIILPNPEFALERDYSVSGDVRLKRPWRRARANSCSVRETIW
jgi:hypothetical protein